MVEKQTNQATIYQMVVEEAIRQGGLKSNLALARTVESSFFLTQLATKYDDLAMVEALASNPHTPVHLLQDYAIQHGNVFEVARNLACNHTVPTRTRLNLMVQLLAPLYPGLNTNLPYQQVEELFVYENNLNNYGGFYGKNQ